MTKIKPIIMVVKTYLYIEQLHVTVTDLLANNFITVHAVEVL